MSISAELDKAAITEATQTPLLREEQSPRPIGRPAFQLAASRHHEA